MRVRPPLICKCRRKPPIEAKGETCHLPQHNLEANSYKQQSVLKMATSCAGQRWCVLSFLAVAFFIGESRSFTSTSYASKAVPGSASSLFATKAPDSKTGEAMSQDYTNEELKNALDSMLLDSKDKDYDARHIFGYGQDDHQLSMLQIITATRILDYKDLMVRTRVDHVCTFGIFLLTTSAVQKRISVRRSASAESQRLRGKAWTHIGSGRGYQGRIAPDGIGS